MDAESNSMSSRGSDRRRRTAAPRPPLQEAGSTLYMPPLSTRPHNPSCKRYGDRFIPERSAMDMDLAHYLLAEPRKEKEKNSPGSSPSGTSRRSLKPCPLISVLMRSKPSR
ncbi:hypothetical protein U9M48_036868 [Paspalum notatum var. saurae]